MTSKKPESFDPLDISNARANPPTVEVAEKVISTIPVRRPNRNEFIRVNPDPEYILDCAVVAFDHPTDGKQYYYLHERLRHLLPDDARPVRLFVAINRHAGLVLWPCTLPSGDGPGRAWHTSALAAADEAMRSWIKIVGKKELGYYVHYKATADLGVPSWPDMSLQELVRIAFKDRVITGPDHEVVRTINGEL